MESLVVRGPSGHAVNRAFWQGKRVLVTGHTGFKGAWASLWLTRLGARVTGFALPPDEPPTLFALTNLASDIDSQFGDLRNCATVSGAVARADPQIVLHMAAQPLVRRSFVDPVETFETNMMGTVHLLDALRGRPRVEAVLVVTTDKVYANDEAGCAFKEYHQLGGHDPYAASKAAVELIVASYAKSFFDATGVPVATARGGNVIGGGDFSVDRIIPDVWRALCRGAPLKLRNPDATRPWQHVLDCVAGYLLYAEALARDPEAPRALNFGPEPGAEVTVATLVETMQKALGAKSNWERDEGPHPREMRLLALDSKRARQVLGWRDLLPGRAAIGATAEWYKAFAAGADMRAHTFRAIEDYCVL
jgi:CDP-glucose 4,6-dehydratase